MLNKLCRSITCSLRTAMVENGEESTKSRCDVAQGCLYFEDKLECTRQSKWEFDRWLINVWLPTLRKLLIENLKLGLFVAKRENDLLVDREAFKYLSGTLGKEAIIWGSLYWQDSCRRREKSDKWPRANTACGAMKAWLPKRLWCSLSIDYCSSTQSAVHIMGKIDSPSLRAGGTTGTSLVLIIMKRDELRLISNGKHTLGSECIYSTTLENCIHCR